MSASSTAPSPDACLDCGAPPVERRVEGERVLECTACGSLRVDRDALNRLRGASPDAHPLLAGSPDDPPANAPSKATVRRCPVCRGTLVTHPFGGGNVRVESCEACEVVFLRKGRLAAIVKETRDGIQMSADARAVLHQHRMMAAGSHFSRAEFGLSTAGLVALVLFLRIVVRTGFSMTAAIAGGAIAIGVLVVRQVHYRAVRAQAAEKMDRLAAEELARLDEKAPPDAHAPEVRALAEGDSGARRASAAKSVVSRDTRSRACPMCRAPLPGGSTHCKACDSDFG